MAVEVTGTLMNYFFHCKRQCYLHGNKLNLEDNSELVQIGGKHSMKRGLWMGILKIEIEHIKLDKLTKEYLTEIKKSDADVEAAKWQTLYYLKILKKRKRNCAQGKDRIFRKKQKQRKKRLL